ncbi:fh1 fh2 domain-containing protein 3 [Lynx pardinus]|uniref:Fh1 fh2 domain-containing protein 3 n=1 Tax=Lynx pardinus TaxID=191816 RepID=A0A485MW94_LYNPA|nr:fh1 fh2 domain-containing protein 3 [Lynx pardinus]
MVPEFKPRVGLCADRREPGACFGFCASSLCPSPARALSLHLSVSKIKLDDCTLQLSHNGAYLDLESTLAEQRDELEGFQDDAGRGKKHSIVLRTQLSVRVHACIGE